MVDTIVFRIGYEEGFEVTPDFLAICKALNPLASGYDHEAGYCVYWPDFKGQRPGPAFAQYDETPRVRVNPQTGTLFSCCHMEPCTGTPLGRITFYPTNALVAVELPRVVDGTHNAMLISPAQAQAAFNRHLAAACAQFPFLNPDDFQMLEIDCYYQTYVPDPAVVVRALESYYRTAVSSSSVSARQQPRKYGNHWVGSRDGKKHYFNCYDKARFLHVAEGLRKLAALHHGLLRVTERIDHADRKHFRAVYDSRSCQFNAGGIRALINHRYRGFRVGAEVTNMEALVEKYDFFKARGLREQALDPSAFLEHVDFRRRERGGKYASKYKCRLMNQLKEVALTDGGNPFHIPDDYLALFDKIKTEGYDAYYAYALPLHQKRLWGLYQEYPTNDNPYKSALFYE